MKNVLLIMPLSYGYNEMIISSLEKKGLIVDFIPDFDESYTKRIFRKFIDINNIQYNYLKSKIDILNKTNIDWILLIRGYNYNRKTIEYLKNKYPKSHLTLYQWDPLLVSRFDEKALIYFDEVFSFDRKDCKKYGFRYLPLFYKSNNYCEEIETKYDFSFVGSGHSQRLFVIGKLLKEIKDRGFTFYVKVYINRIEFFKGCLLNKPGFRNFPKECISFKPVNKKYADKIVAQSRIVIDVNHPSQSGLSIRIPEVLGFGKKIITTNKSILEEKFYDQNVIGIIEDCKLPKRIEEMMSNTERINVENLEINNWVNNLLP